MYHNKKNLSSLYSFLSAKPTLFTSYLLLFTSTLPSELLNSFQ
ncbi:hypothetical protein HMPREF1977_1890 [Capnocytophaga ochracea F0287]|uniref:Uncharacterized protein n=1 Tax=Capnocytophaga ochracea F0287 TaxID=873517 RepID=E4MU18_CAPOC|nr:hypothetical protein HMPREF1977_1890 [Capnocytophaga ochracea F0287]EJF45571.1 hypothetical protein HMPREF1319_0689 [Capnocytophaga ochracea str. Holt 25]